MKSLGIDLQTYLQDDEGLEPVTIYFTIIRLSVPLSPRDPKMVILTSHFDESENTLETSKTYKLLYTLPVRQGVDQT